MAHTDSPSRQLAGFEGALGSKVPDQKVLGDSRLTIGGALPGEGGMAVLARAATTLATRVVMGLSDSEFKERFYPGTTPGLDLAATAGLAAPEKVAQAAPQQNKWASVPGVVSAPKPPTA